MIPTVSKETVNTVIVQEGRDTLAYIKESMELFSERQPVLKDILFGDVEKVLEKCHNGEDSPELTELKLKGIFSLVVRCIYSQDEVNELAAQWSDNG